MIQDFSMSQKTYKYVPLNLLRKQEQELKQQEESVSLLINSPKLPQQAKTSSFLEVPGIEKPRDISVYTPVKRDHTLLPESEQKEENGKEQEEEDDISLDYSII